MGIGTSRSFSRLFLSAGVAFFGFHLSDAYAAAPPPSASTSAATNVTSTSATINGVVNPNGIATTAKFEYGLTNAYGSSKTVTLSPNNGLVDQNVSSALTGLSGHKTYHFRISATNSASTTNGSDLTFDTPNRAPIVSNLGLSTWAGRAVISRPNAPSDPDGDTLAFSLGDAPSHGVIAEVKSNDGLFLYTPEAGYTGSDSFSIAVSDGVATVNSNFSVQIDEAPASGTQIYTSVGASDNNAVGASDFAHGYTSLIRDRINAMYGAGSFVLSNRGVNGFTAADIRRTVGGTSVLQLALGDSPRAVSLWIGPNDAIAFSQLPSQFISPAVSQFEVDYNAILGALKGIPNVAIATANVPKIGDLPVATALGLTPFQKAALNELCRQLTVKINTAAGNLNVPLLNIYDDPAISFQPGDISGDGFHPSDQGYKKMADTAFPLLRPQLNRTPVASGQTLSTDMNTDLTGTLTGTDPDLDEDALVFAKGTEPTHGTLTLNTATGAFTYSPAANYSGSDSFTFTANDGDASSAPATVSITVTFVPDTTKPALSFSTPSNNQTLDISSLNAITGNAADNFGVTDVLVKIFRVRNGVMTFWNGTTFGTANVQLPATVASPGSTNTGWTFTVTPELKAALDKGQYGLVGYAKDAAGNQSNAVGRYFTLTIDAGVPVVTITTPAEGQNVAISALKTISGTVTDDVAATQVQVRISRVRGGNTEYWNGSSFDSTSTFLPATIAAPGGASANWSFTVSPALRAALDNGAYTVDAVAKDGVNNSSDAVTHNFTLYTDTTAPVIVFNTPFANQTLDAADFNTITGKATDNFGVTDVLVKIFRVRNGVTTFWNGTSFGSAQVQLPADVATPGSTNTTWTFTVTPELKAALDNGQYGLVGYGRDAAGNVSGAIGRYINITGVNAPLRFTPPAQLKTSPSSNQF